MIAFPHQSWHTRTTLLTLAGFHIVMAYVMAGCAGIPIGSRLITPDSSPTITRAVGFSGKPSGIALRPKGLHFLQASFHNCGTVAMLMSWAKLHGGQAASLVWRQPGRGYTVRFPAVAPVSVTEQDLQEARRSHLVRSPAGDPWALVALTAFAKIKDPSAHPDFHGMEWIDPREIGYCLAGPTGDVFRIKEETTGVDGRPKMEPPISLESLHEKLRAVRGHPAAASTNRRIHIWAVFGYDPVHRLVYIRNPRRLDAEWMPLTQFRDEFELVVYLNSPDPVRA